MMKQYKCSVCGYIYDFKKGDSEGGIAEGTTFDKLPEDWTCPVCRSEKSVFKEISDENIAPQHETHIDKSLNNSNYDNDSDDGICEI